ncbi:MAG: gamma-glutamyl-gamma-aminobutyrate hydrolase family protein [Pseudomonadales bacterium]|nr:gamma-glutamyl-gamma-aminobutyrate hydrolase family protein [Pseudomonadales bacterium]
MELSSNKPLIGVTGPDRGGYAAWLMTSLALRRAGAKPVRITPSRPFDESLLQGVIIGGGSDVDPEHYGEAPEPLAKHKRSPQLRIIDYVVNLLLFLLRWVFSVKDVQRYDPDRDQLEKHMIQYALHSDLPLLGICRGAQLLNIVLGGSLYQQIQEFYGEIPFVRSLLPLKRVLLEQNSRLSDLFQSHSCVVNALHNQAIKDTGQQVIITARDRAGVVQGIEYLGHEFVVGVQWHPEYLPQLPQHQLLFKSLVDSSRRHLT